MNKPAHKIDSPIVADAVRLRRHQLDRLRSVLDPALARNPFYRRKLTDAGLTTASEVSLWDDYARLPFTTKIELSEDQVAAPPFGTNLSEPIERYTRLHQTSGTTGTPLRWLDTPESWQWWARCWQQVYAGAGVTADDRVFFAFSFGPFIGFWSAMAGAEAVGCLVVAGGGMGSNQRLDALIANRASVLVSTPTYALHLAEVARQSGIDLDASGIRITIHAGEPGAAIPATRSRLEALWGARCFDHAGATEVGAWGFECQNRNGLHLNEEEFICEVIDPQTGAAADEGELVITNLGRVASPVIRYRTGDHVRLASDSCDCGSSFRRCLGGVLGRVDDAIIVRGVNVFPSAIENIIRSHAGALEFRIEVFRRAEMDEIVLHVELDDSAATSAIAAAIHTRLGLRATVLTAPTGSLPRSELKAQRFLDHRH